MLGAKVAVVLLCALVVVSADYSFSGNLSASVIANNGWKYHRITVDSFAYTDWVGANYVSGDGSGSLYNGSLDIVTGSAYAYLTGYPFSFLTYYRAAYNLNISINGGSTFQANLDVSKAEAYVGTAYLALVEKNPNGTVVATKSLRWVVVGNGFSYTRTDKGTSGNNLAWVTFTGTDSGSSTVVTLTFLVSNVAGVINNNIPIVPSALESVVSISGYTYKNSANSLSLLLGVGNGGLNVTKTKRTVYSGGSSVYFSLSDKVVVGGKIQDATVSEFAAADISVEVGNANFAAQLTAKYGAAATFNLVSVTFPAGATNIVYDPSMGAGAAVQDSYTPDSPASSLIISISLLLIAMIAHL